jgi:Cu+-exporting ATPase
MKHRLIAITVVVLALGLLPVTARNAVSADSGATHEHHMHGDEGHHPHSIEAANVIVDLEARPAEIKAGIPATILFTVKDTDGKPIQDLTVTHERLLHVIIAGEDFSVFGHIHPEDFGPITPEMRKSAEFPVRFIFPKAGRYLIAVDSAVKDVSFSEHFTLDVAGEPRMGQYKKDLSRKKLFGDYEVTLSSEPGRIVAGKEVTLRYLIKKEEGPVKDLKPYLSAPMHLSIIQADLNNFIHTHGELPGTEAGRHMAGHRHMHMTVPEKFGPVIDAHVVFPARGLYQIFGEIKHQGRVIVTSFMVDVE